MLGLPSCLPDNGHKAKQSSKQLQFYATITNSCVAWALADFDECLPSVLFLSFTFNYTVVFSFM